MSRTVISQKLCAAPIPYTNPCTQFLEISKRSRRADSGVWLLEERPQKPAHLKFN
ncbi:hypothetical protein KIN20_002487 [Parelaphostrongylus tenuis]|uniref:Uncharacterized protein n=1 Tax=Parelaphostrongylus tenuis TaxID=148309 RepID=A0AAD5ME96_PARTN|nr:hypothetical protein KIN20_002487 [Parelaphostrongylus tenuis]